MPETEFKYDVFISYSHKDEEWVINTLLPALENAGLKVCIDYRDFIAGKPAIINMADASETSHHTLLVLTPRWVESEWTLFESILSRTDDPSGLQRRTIPLLLEKCKPPKFISMLSWVDFTDKKRENEAWQNLFKSLDKEVEKVEVAKAEADSWHLAHPYPMPPNFTGRIAERTMLSQWLNDDTENRLFIIRALGGFGKSALSWHWLTHDVDSTQWTKLVWWSFYEGDASFEHFIEETLKYLKLEPPQGQRPQVDELLKAMQSQKILLIMDGFERALRAYSSMNAAYQGDEPKVEDNQLDCVNINAEIFLKSACSLPNIKSKVLMTTRLTPRAVKPRGEFILGCREVELTSMQPADAVEFFHKQGIKGTHAEIEAACAPYGYHPLSLRLLAGRILKDFENPADIAVAQKLKVDGDIIQQKHHVLEVSYNSLPEREQELLSTIACFRFPVELKTLKAIAENKDVLDSDLHDLVARGLLHFDDKNKNFDLHPIVRQYTYECLTAPDRKATHTLVRDYFAAVVVPEKPRSYNELLSVFELYHHTVRAGEYDAAWVLYDSRLRTPLYYYFGKYHEDIELLEALSNVAVLPYIGSRRDQTWILIYLSMNYQITGQLQKALELNDQVLALNKDKKSLADWGASLAERGSICRHLGRLKDAENSMAESVALFGRLQSSNWIGISHRNYGNILIACGNLSEAKKQLDIAEQTYIRSGESSHLHGLSRTYIYRSFLFEQSGDPDLAVDCAQKARNFAIRGNYLRELVMADYCLGKMFLVSNSLADADSKFREALSECRKMNLLDLEPEVLLGLATTRREMTEYSEAIRLAKEALSITERCGYVLQGADVNLFLAQYALEQEKDKIKAKAYAEEALKLATCDGPPYYYKVAYEEAERFLENLK